MALIFFQPQNLMWVKFVGSILYFDVFTYIKSSSTVHDSITLLHLRNSITVLQDVTVLTSSHLHEIISSLQYTTVFFY